MNKLGQTVVIANEKPHKGTIRQWIKLPCPQLQGEQKHLGFRIAGVTKDHPELSRDGSGDDSIITSYVVWFDDLKPDGSVEIATRNSRYTLRDEFKETAKV